MFRQSGALIQQPGVQFLDQRSGSILSHSVAGTLQECARYLQHAGYASTLIGNGSSGFQHRHLGTS